MHELKEGKYSRVSGWSRHSRTMAAAEGTNSAKSTNARLAAASAEPRSNLTDVVSDLQELLYLFDDVELMPSSTSTATLAFLNQIDVVSMRAQVRRHLDSIERARTLSITKDMETLLRNVRRDYLAIKAKLRGLYRARGVAFCADDWQSPIYAATGDILSNRLNEGIYEHVLDYKRDGHLDAMHYEANFVNEYARRLGAESCRAYLTNSGMAAFTTILNWLAHEENIQRPVVTLAPMYFENLHLIRGIYPDMTQLNQPTARQLQDHLKNEQPAIVFADIVSNCGTIIAHEVEVLLDWAKNDSVRDVVLVIDTTCLPVSLLPANLLSDMPEHVSIILFESLAKYHQFGLDMVTGGIVLACMSADLHNSFNKTRARLGTNIADSSVAALPSPNFAQLATRMLRHSANTELLATGLESIAEDKTGIFESISWLKDKSNLASWYHNTCFTISFKSRYQSVKHFREFEFKVLDAAKVCGLDIALSTSFGFDSTRLYVTAPATRFEPPFLRVSVGTETVGEISCLLKAMGKVNTELAAQWGMEPEPLVAEVIPSVKQPAEVIALTKATQSKNSDSLITKSVFAGENSLLDYLCPENYAPTPLVEVPTDLNPYRSQGIRIFAKMMPLVPLMNIKSLPAFSMLEKAAQRGDLAGVTNLIESSSSNTVLSLSILGKLFGINKTSAIVDHSIAPALLKMLRLFGIEPHLHPGPGHELFDQFQPRSDRATDWGAQDGWFNPGQYTNLDNPQGFARYLAPDIWKQTQGRIAALTCGLGTCGTMVGVSSYLREQKSSLQVVGCCPAVNHNVPGPRQLSQLADVTFDWKTVADQRFELTAAESFAGSLKLIRRGIMGGPSSGMNYEATLQYFNHLIENDPASLEEMRDGNGEIWSVFLCCDSPLQHVDDYYRVLGEDHFPAVQPIPTPSTSSVVDTPQGLSLHPDDNFEPVRSFDLCRQEIVGS